MTASTPNTPGITDGTTVVISHRIRDGFVAEYEAWLDEISAACRAAAGFVDWQIIRPIAPLSGTYTVVIRFDSQANVRTWMESATRAQFIERIKHCFENDDDFYIRSGLDFWFVPEGAKAKVPVAWKQYLITWSAIFPLSLVVQLTLIPLVHWLGQPENRVLDTLELSGTVVALMVFVVMPRYTKLVRKWLFH
jgi:antibiotic biosynthesis monooxygenase (ABM) superfamily enzyme